MIRLVGSPGACLLSMLALRLFRLSNLCKRGSDFHQGRVGRPQKRPHDGLDTKPGRHECVLAPVRHITPLGSLGHSKIR